MNLQTGVLAELADATKTMPALEGALIAREKLDRLGLDRLHLTEYLELQGYSGHDLASAIGPFGKAVKDGFRDFYGRDPINALDPVRGELTPVAHYFECDRWLVDLTFRSLFGAEPVPTPALTPPQASFEATFALLDALEAHLKRVRRLLDEVDASLPPAPTSAPNHPKEKTP